MVSVSTKLLHLRAHVESFNAKDILHRSFANDDR